MLRNAWENFKNEGLKEGLICAGFSALGILAGSAVKSLVKARAIEKDEDFDSEDESEEGIEE